MNASAEWVRVTEQFMDRPYQETLDKACDADLNDSYLRQFLTLEACEWLAAHTSSITQQEFLPCP